MIAIVKSPQYERDMEEIWEHIAQHNPDAADRVVMAVESMIELLGEFPASAHRALIWLQDYAEPCGANIWSIIASEKPAWRSSARCMAAAMSLLSNFMTEHSR
jgi:hypothetical protein